MLFFLCCTVRRLRPIPLKYVIKGVQGPPCRGLGCPQFLLLLLLAAAGGKQKERKEVFRGHPDPGKGPRPLQSRLFKWYWLLAANCQKSKRSRTDEMKKM